MVEKEEASGAEDSSARDQDAGEPAPAERSSTKPKPESKKASERPRAARDEEDDDDDDEAAPSPPPVRHPPYSFLAVWSLAFLAADLGTKYWALQALTDRPKWKIIDDVLAFDLVHNPGGAGGVLGDLPDHIRLPLFFLISAVAVVFIVSLYKRLEPRQVALKWALPLVLGGAAGNLVDRIRYQRVVDFIEVTRHWPTFNVADIWITVGVGLMLVDMFTAKPTKKKKKAVASVSASSDGAAEKG